MNTQHVAVAYDNTVNPLRLYKLAGESLKQLPLDVSDVYSVIKVAFSPNGKWMAAIRRTLSGVNRVHLWNRPDLNSDAYVKIAVPNLPTATATPTDLAFISDSELVVTAGKTSFGAINQSTGVITWSVAPEDVSTTDRDSRTAVYVIEPGRQIITVTANSATTGTYQYYKNSSGVWTRVGAGVGANGRAIKMHSPGLGLALVGPSSSNSLSGVTVDLVSTPPATIVTSAAGAAMRLYNSSLDGVVQPGSTNTVSIRPELSNDKSMLFIPVTDAPWIACRRIDDPRKPPVFAGAVDWTFPTLNLAINRIQAAADNIIFIAHKNNVESTNLIKAFRYLGNDTAPVEIPSISAMFAADSAVASTVAVSIAQEESAPLVQVYDDVIAGLINGTIPFDNVGIVLMSSAAVFDQTDNLISDVIGVNEAYSTSWPQGGVTASYSGLEFHDGVWSFKLIIPSVAMAAGESLTFRSMTIFDKTSGRPIAFVRFDADKTIDNLQVLALAPVNNDLFTFTVTEND